MLARPAQLARRVSQASPARRGCKALLALPARLARRGCRVFLASPARKDCKAFPARLARWAPKAQWGRKAHKAPLVWMA